MLRVRALGHLEVAMDDRPIALPTRKCEELLCYLLIRRTSCIERGAIAEELWPCRPPGSARHSLSTELWRLNRALRVAAHSGPAYIRVENSYLSFDDAAPYWFDVEAFEEAARSGMAMDLSAPAGTSVLRGGLDLYRGDLLAGCLSDWCLLERERLLLLRMRAMKTVQHRCRTEGRYDLAIEIGRKLLGLDYLQEDVHRELMQCYAQAGQRSLALRQFAVCREQLRSELGVEPMPATFELRASIAQQRSSSPPTWGPQVASLQAAVERFGSASSRRRARREIAVAALPLTALRSFEASLIGPPGMPMRPGNADASARCGRPRSSFCTPA